MLGAGTAAAGTGAAAMAGGTSALGALGGASFIPVLGWILAISALVDLISGGKLFGTSFRPESTSATVGLDSEGGFASASMTEVRNRSLFRGRQRRDSDIDVGPEAESAGDSLYRMVRGVFDNSVTRLRTDSAEMINAAFTTTITYDKKGKKQDETTSATINGRVYEGIDAAEFQNRIMSEAVIAAVKGSAIDIAGEAAGLQVDAIADRWRDSAEALQAGADLLLDIQQDAVNGFNLLGGYNLRGVVDVIEDFAVAGETLNDTYTRLKASVELVENALGGFVSKADLTQTEFVKFSADFVVAMGGVEAASQKLQLFTSVFGGVTENFNARLKALASRERAFSAIGMDSSTNAVDFAAAFVLVADSLGPQELANWIDAGNAIAVVENSIRQLTDRAGQLSPSQQVIADLNSQIIAIEDLGASEAELLRARVAAGEIIQQEISKITDSLKGEFEGDNSNDLVSSLNDRLRAMQELGASEEQLAEARRYALGILSNALADFMSGFEDQLADFEGRSNLREVEKIRREMEKNIIAARKYGASLQQIGRIQQLATYQIAKVISELRTAITDLVTQLYGQQATEQTNTYYNNREENESSLADLERERYASAREAIKRITDFLDGLETGELNPGDYTDRLSAARSQFQDILSRAMSGDQDALSQITDAAGTYLDLSREFLGNSDPYAAIYDAVTASLRGLRDQLSLIPDPGEGPDAGGSSGSGGSDNQASAQIDRFSMAFQLAQMLGEFALIMDVPLSTVMEGFNVTIAQLATDMGISAVGFNDNMTSNFALLAGALGIGVADLMLQLGVTSAQMAAAFNISLSSFNAENLLAIREMSSSFGLSIWEGLDLLGLSLAEIALGFGLTSENLSLQTVAGFVQLAEDLGVDFVSLATTLGVDIVTLATTISESIEQSLTTLPDMPDDIRLQLASYLDAIREADTTAEISTGVGNLNSFMDTLPEDLRDPLRSVMEGLGLATVLNLNTADSMIVDLLPIQVALGRDTLTAALAVVRSVEAVEAFLGPDGNIGRGIEGIDLGIEGLGIEIAGLSEAVRGLDFGGNFSSSGVGYNPYGSSGDLNTTSDPYLGLPDGGSASGSSEASSGPSEVEVLSQKVEELTEVVDRQLSALNDKQFDSLGKLSEINKTSKESALKGNKK
jgi:hypothetical protein